MTDSAEPDSRIVPDPLLTPLVTGPGNREPDSGRDGERRKKAILHPDLGIYDEKHGVILPSPVHIELIELRARLAALGQENESQQHVFDHTVRRLNRELEQAWQKESEAQQRAEEAKKASEDWEGTAREQAGTIETLHKKLREPGEAWSENPRTPTSEATDGEN